MPIANRNIMHDVRHREEPPAGLWVRVARDTGYPPTWERIHCGCDAPWWEIERINVGRRYRLTRLSRPGAHDRSQRWAEFESAGDTCEIDFLPDSCQHVGLS